MPLGVAELLGFWPTLPGGKVIKTYETTAGTVRLHHLERSVEIQVLAEKKHPNPWYAQLWSHNLKEKPIRMKLYFFVSSCSFCQDCLVSISFQYSVKKVSPSSP